MVDQGELEGVFDKRPKKDLRRVDNTINDLMICIWKTMSKDPNSTTFQAVKDEKHVLYKCYDCLSVGMNVCESYAPTNNLKKIHGDYR